MPLLYRGLNLSEMQQPNSVGVSTTIPETPWSIIGLNATRQLDCRINQRQMELLHRKRLLIGDFRKTSRKE